MTTADGAPEPDAPSPPPSPTSRAAALDDALEQMIAEHTADADQVVAARRDYEERRGRVFQEEELWERWSAAFVEWFVVERVAPGAELPPAAASLARARAAGDARAARVIRAWLTSHRSLFEVRALDAGRVELLDLLGGAVISVAEPRAMLGVSVGDVVELRVIGLDGDVVFGRTFVFHPRGTRDTILTHARRIVGAGGDRRAVIDHVAALRVRVERYRHMPAAKVYELPTEAGRPVRTPAPGPRDP
ncbi:MAG: hypothetical protein H6709_07745 [Kofleriaceae bacterium]|nr:hypothetical protein [Kofleriaceae bacterium]